MDGTKRPPGADLTERLTAAIEQTLAQVPRVLQDAADRSRLAREEQAKAMEAAREQIRAGARLTPHRFRL